MKIRVTGTSEECDEAVAKLAKVLHVVSSSQPYRQRGQSTLVNVYLEVRLR